MRSCLQVVLVSITLFFSAGLIVVVANAGTSVSGIDLSADTPLIPMATVSANRVLPSRNTEDQPKTTRTDGMGDGANEASTPDAADARLPVTKLNDAVQATQPTTYADEVRTTSDCNLRSGPGTTYEIIGTRSAGEILTLIAVNNAGDWYELSDGAWIASFLVANAPSSLPLSKNELP